MLHYFELFIYQPFFNLLVFFYWGLEFITQGNADMGIAVILLTIVVRVLLLPLSLAEQRSEKERKEITEQMRQIEEMYKTDPIGKEKAKKAVIKTNKRILIAELINLIIQVMVALMLWRMFKTGLTGQDIHFLYPFMPDVEQPFNLVFLGKYDLTHASLTLNLIQTLCIFVLESLLIFGSEDEISKKQFVRLQFVLPIISFFIFLFLPAGKKLFVITTLIFSTILTIYRITMRKFLAYKEKQEQPPLPPGEQLVVEVK